VLGEAIEIDPDFARAWETLAAVYAVSRAWELVDRDYLTLALDAADKALALNPDLSLPYAVRGNTMREFMAAHPEYRWEDSLANLDQAIAHDPNDATAHLWRGLAFLALGYFDRALQDMTRCSKLDPAYGHCWRFMARTHLYAGRTDEALRTFELAVEKGFPNLEALFPAVYAKRGNRAAALLALADAYSDQPRLIGPLHRALTDPAFDETERKEALAIVDAAPPGWFYEYETRLFLRDYDRIRPERNVDTLLWYREDAAFLKSEARKRLMRQYRLPDYWRQHGFPPQCRAVGAADFSCD
jgi:tetratricopeptide (TPR) repeat protein